MAKSFLDGDISAEYPANHQSDDELERIPVSELELLTVSGQIPNFRLLLRVFHDASMVQLAATGTSVLVIRLTRST